MSNETKQTAIEWYAQRLYEITKAYNQDVINTNIYIQSKKEALEQAKEMEKEQHYQTAENWWATDHRPIIKFQFKQWWNETYGGNK